jgi:hypothetical protein
MCLKAVRWDEANWIDLVQDRGRREDHHLGEQINKLEYYIAVLNKYILKNANFIELSLWRAQEKNLLLLLLLCYCFVVFVLLCFLLFLLCC